MKVKLNKKDVKLLSVDLKVMPRDLAGQVQAGRSAKDTMITCKMGGCQQNVIKL